MIYYITCRIVKDNHTLYESKFNKTLEAVEKSISLAKQYKYDIKLYYTDGRLNDFEIYQPLKANSWRIYKGVIVNDSKDQ